MMHAMIFEGVGLPLREVQCPIPSPQVGQVLLKVLTCGVCRTDLHIMDGDLTPPKLPLIMGHQIVGIVEKLGTETSHFRVGDRVGVPWLGSTCGQCYYCKSGKENLCDEARFTGLHINGGYTQYTVADERFCFAIPDGFSSLQAAPLLCAGLIGFRSLRLAGEARNIGFYGFGSAAHVVIQAANFLGHKVFAFTRDGDKQTQDFARSLGAVWAGNSSELPPELLDAAIIFAPSGELVPIALKAVRKGGSVVCAGIHMTDIPSFPYELVWGERVVRSVANLTRSDGSDFLSMAPKIPIRTQIQTWPLNEANEALAQLRSGRIHGTAVLVTEAGQKIG